MRVGISRWRERRPGLEDGGGIVWSWEGTDGWQGNDGWLVLEMTVGGGFGYGGIGVRSLRRSAHNTHGSEARLPPINDQTFGSHHTSYISGSF